MSEAEALLRRLAGWKTSDEAVEAAGATGDDDSTVEALDTWREGLDDDVDDIIKEARRVVARMES